MCGFADLKDFKEHTANGSSKRWKAAGAPREDRWSEALAVGSLAFVERVKNDLGVKAAHREVLEAEAFLVSGFRFAY